LKIEEEVAFTTEIVTFDIIVSRKYPMKLNPELIRWLERNPGRHPRLVKPAATQEEKLERKAADCLSRLKAKAVNGALPVEHADRLTQVRCSTTYMVILKSCPVQASYPACSQKPSLQHLPSTLVVKSRITFLIYRALLFLCGNQKAATRVEGTAEEGPPVIGRF
jgi:hypothetical protein